MDLAVVTGASSGIGLAIAERLVRNSYVVYGIARDFTKCAFTHDRLIPTVCDVLDSRAIEDVFEKIAAAPEPLRVLVNSAGIGIFGPHETLSLAQIDQMVRTNLTAPLLLTKLALRTLKKNRGTVINIASTAALSPHRLGCAYGASKAGLLHFGESLFEEVRKSGVRVCTVCPDMTADTGFYDDASFAPSDEPDCHITPSCVADAVWDILQRRDGTAQTLAVLKPQRIGISHKR